jgi:hypothetical protein
MNPELISIGEIRRTSSGNDMINNRFILRLMHLQACIAAQGTTSILIRFSLFSAIR